MRIEEKRDRLGEFIRLIAGSLDEEVGRASIAGRGNISRYHFDRLVSAAMGESAGAFRRRLLLERAAWWLRAPGARVTDFAFDSGYDSVEGFTRAFTQAFSVSPSRYRRSNAGFRLPAPNGVHFHPPGGIGIPGNDERSVSMDFVDRLVGHDVWFTNRLLDRAGDLPPDALDRPVLADSPRLFGDGPITLRALLNAMVANKENWSAAISGERPTASTDESLDGLRRRFDVAGKEFERLIGDIRNRGDWNTGFVDALCDPPESFTYGGMLAHVMTFSAWRRGNAILAFRELGIEDLGIGDPIAWERGL
ncbi:MAG TPA: helix-turn-helix domain-containing protein [Chloroflexota bacterium]|nr:helix-turn-helix domain-containing protein [Chloroflexota bacterium]